MRKLYNWFTNTGLFASALFLLAFIPLYPKLPLIDIVQTWVYIRLEDFFVLVACVLLLAAKLRERRIPDTPITVPVIVYFTVIGISLVNALLFIFPSIPTQLYPHLALLHFVRRVEYLSVFFLAFEGYRRHAKLGWVIGVLSVTYAAVLVYGFGQKFLGFPAFLTMNEEFAKGLALRLPSTARIPSTFGGHYDLGAFLVFTIPVMGSLVFGMKKWYLKGLYFLLAVFGLVVLLFTASRISFGVYLVAMSVMLLWHRKPLLILPVVVLSILILNFTSGASERFYKTFRVSDVVIDLSTGKPIGTLDKLEGTSATLAKSESPAEESLPKGSEFINIPGRQPAATSSSEGQVQKVEYLTSEGLKKGTGEVATISGSFLVQKALVYDISITTRMQGQWPKAITAFKRNILLGSGLSSLSVAADGDYHRMLGETGLLGAVAFLGILATSFVVFFRTRDRVEPLTRALAVGVFAGVVGLLFNAVLIDVFEASKVAFSLWIILGFTMAALVAKHPTRVDYFGLLKRIFTHPIAYMAYLILAVFLVWGGALSMYFLGDDFTWTRWAAVSSPGDIVGYFTRAQGFFYRPIPKLWYFLLFSVFWLKPFSYHLASLGLLSVITVGLYRFLRGQKIPWWMALTAAMVFITRPILHENMFWISGHSSLLSAAFLITGLILFQTVWNGIKRPWNAVCTVLAVLSLFASMLSYDGMLVVPLIVSFLAVFLRGKDKRYWLLLLMIPVYYAIRTYAGAVNPSGDYGYRASTFPVNALGNTVSYVLGYFAGPWALESVFGMRAILRQYLILVTIGATGVLFVGTALAFRMRAAIQRYRDAFLFIVAFLLSLAAYAGLGNASERYAFIPSLFFTMGLSSAAAVWWKSHRSITAKALLAGLVLLLLVTGVKEVRKLEGEWKKASDIAQSSLLAIKQEAYPPKDDLTFFFVNPPSRYGRAWIFPVGLNDALWHMFRDNLYSVSVVPSIKAGFDAHYKGTRYIYVFEDYVLKRGMVRPVD